MKVVIKNKNLEDYNKEFKVKRINYDKVLVIYPGREGIKEFNIIDTETISENKIDDFLLENREFLKIRLQRGMSVFFYNGLLDALKLECGEEIKNLDLFIDNYTINKSGIWDKELLIVVNKYYPIKVLATGKKFTRKNYNFKIDTLEKEEFLNISSIEKEKIIKEIFKKEKLLKKYNEAEKNVYKPVITGGLLKEKNEG